MTREEFRNKLKELILEACSGPVTTHEMVGELEDQKLGIAMATYHVMMERKDKEGGVPG